jgi:Flp pilus assembly protein CpaB
LVVALVAGLIAAGSIVLLVTYVSSQVPVTTTRTGSGPTSTTRVVVATADLNAGDRLTTSNVGLSDYPSAALPPGGSQLYYTEIAKVTATAQYTSSSLPKGALILATLLVATSSGPVVSQPPIDIKNAGDVAISVPFDETKGAGGFVQPEDHLDMLVDDTATGVQYAFQDVRVIKVGGRAEQGGALSVANLLLIELPREQAAVLTYLEDRSFNIRYAIRPHDQFGKGPLPNSGPINGSNWNQFLSR